MTAVADVSLSFRVPQPMVRWSGEGKAAPKLPTMKAAALPVDAVAPHAVCVSVRMPAQLFTGV